MKPMVCTKCRKFLHPKKNGVFVEEGRPEGAGWAPYKIWHGDAWECRECGIEIISGFGREAVVEHYMPEYEQFKSRVVIHVFVEDC